MTQPAPLSFEAANGALWTFDPAAQKWTVVLDGQKSSSQKYETLTAKVDKWQHAARAAAKASEAPANVAPVTPQVFSFGMARALDYSSANGPESLLTIAIPPRTNDGVTVKTSWNAEQQRFDVLRYRSWSSEASRNVPSWESSQADRQNLINFDALDADDQAWWRDLFEHRAQVALAGKARRAISAAWIALKEDATGIYETTSRRKQEETGERFQRIQRHNAMDNSHTWQVLDGCPVYTVETLTGTDGWTSMNGTWARMVGDTTLRLSFEANQSSLPSFRLHRETADGTSEPVWNGPTFDIGLALANASAQAFQAKTPLADGWQVSMGYQHDVRQGFQGYTLGLGHFPVGLVQQAAVFCTADDPRQSDLWVLGRSDNRSVTNPFSADVRPLFSRNDDASFGWHRMSKTGKSEYFLAKGPEDALLEVMADLDTITRQAVSGFVDLLTRESLGQRLNRQAQATLKDAYDLAGDGETLSDDPAFMVNRWQDTVRREEARANRLPAVTAFAGRCEALVERATLVATDLGHSFDGLVAKVQTKGPGAAR